MFYNFYVKKEEFGVALLQGNPDVYNSNTKMVL